MQSVVAANNANLSIPSSEHLVRRQQAQDARQLRSQLRELQQSPLLKLARAQMKQGESMIIHSELSHKTYEGRGSHITWDHRCELKFSLTLTSKGFGWSEDRPAGYDSTKDESYINTKSGYLLWTSRIIRLMKSGLTIDKVLDVLNDKIQGFNGAVGNSGR